jgi:lysozyme
VNLDKLYDLIRRWESLRLKPYLCPAGVPTIGYGHTGPEVTLKSLPFTPRLAEEVMREDVQRTVMMVLKISPNLVPDNNRLCAIADFCFNLGMTRYLASTLHRKVRDGEWADAADELQKWVWGGGRKLPGLILRRAAEASLVV